MFRVILAAVTAALLLGPAPAAAAERQLRTLLVTGDSMSTPLNIELDKLVAPHGVRVVSDLHYGGGVSKDFVFDWPRQARSIVSRVHPDATIVFIGANEGFPLRPAGARRKVSCCGSRWAAAYSARVARMLKAYRRRGVGRVYWVTVPALRDDRRTRIGRVINRAARAAAARWPGSVRVIEGGAIFSPDGYRDAMPVDGVETVVREPDGMHLNAAGSRVLALAAVARFGRDFAL
jgi:hypothetical protein